MHVGKPVRKSSGNYLFSGFTERVRDMINWE